jgi:hypothetical protein
MRLGLVIYRGRAVYGNGYGLMLPMPILNLVVQVWNCVACRVLGHDDVLWHLKQADASYTRRPTCVACLAPLTGCVGRHDSGVEA